MPFVHMIYVETDDPQVQLGPLAQDAMRGIIRGIPGLARALMHLPAQARDYYTDDGPSPRLALQLYYAELEILEDTLRPDGYLRKMTDPALWAELVGPCFTHQVMYSRSYPVEDPRHMPDMDEPAGSYLVHYPGAAEDLNLWLNYYLDHHPQIMKSFPRIREIEICTRVGWRDSMPWQRVDYMQRNRLIFDSVAALEAALNSPVRHQMRADFKNFPAFTGGSVHFPMHTEDLAL